ncbi:type II toxin-antitoxin system RelE/ParE family toxin [Gemmatimonas sp.]|uniref:type II toxin-antitoxin system RelE/ParE family toxin n=1 Tax=Gemmatimonas sp. TaxID=1962908 RepID=UPI0037BFD988
MGEDFVAEVRQVTALVVRSPDAGAPMASGRRRWLCERFPYAVVYRVAPDGSIRVLAVAHHRRRPGYWRSRTERTHNRERRNGALQDGRTLGVSRQASASSRFQFSAAPTQCVRESGW